MVIKILKLKTNFGKKTLAFEIEKLGHKTGLHQNNAIYCMFVQIKLKTDIISLKFKC